MRNSKSLKRVLSIMVSASMMVTASGVLTAPLQVSAAETTIIPVQLWDFSQDAAGWYYETKTGYTSTAAMKTPKCHMMRKETH